MLTREDLTPLKNKEGYIAAARKRHPGSKANGGTTNFSQTVRGAISIDTGDSGGYEDEGPGASQPVYGGDGGEESGEGNSNGLGEQFRRNSVKSPRRDGGVYQSKRPASGSIWSGIKDTAKQYSDALKKDTSKKSKSVAKKTEQRTLTDAEVIKMRPKLIEYIIWQSEHMDDFISATTRGHETVEIWSNLDQDDAEIIADFLISRARVSVNTAVVVRTAAGLMDKIKLGLIIGPRVLSTFRIYMERGFSIGPIYQRR